MDPSNAGLSACDSHVVPRDHLNDGPLDYISNIRPPHISTTGIRTLLDHQQHDASTAPARGLTSTLTSSSSPSSTFHSSSSGPSSSSSTFSPLPRIIIHDPDLEPERPRSAQSSLSLLHENAADVHDTSSRSKRSGKVEQRVMQGNALPTILENQPAQLGLSLKARRYGAVVKRWDPSIRPAPPWDNLRRDPELWYDRGNCLVYLCAKNSARRGPSFRVPLAAIHSAHLSNIFHLYDNRLAPALPGLYHNGDEDPLRQPSSYCELFIPAPENYGNEDSIEWHLGTRNLFAYLLGKPVAGEHLCDTLVRLFDRICLIRPHNSDNVNDFCAYIDRIGYLDFSHRPDYALAMLQLAEYYKMGDLWVDAFAHCVGMNNRLIGSSEFECTSSISKALITRSYLEMDVHVGKATRALSNFLEDALSSSYLGLDMCSRSHLERFRSFLHSFYVEKFGYWPPPSSFKFPKSLYRSMYSDFRCLYDLLVDTTVYDPQFTPRPATGGICVLQNLEAFDRRHKMVPLPSQIPLVPDLPAELDKVPSQKQKFSLRLMTQPTRGDGQIIIRASLLRAVNHGAIDSAALSSPLTKAYLQFEADWSQSRDPKVSISDGRKIRWILVYAVLQTLISVLRAPKEVRNTEGPTYPLCCLVTQSLPWEAGNRALNSSYGPSRFVPPPSTANIQNGSDVDKASLMSGVDIAPDCETSDFITPVTTNQSSAPNPPVLVRSNSSRPGSSHSASSRLRGLPLRSLSLLSSGRKWRQTAQQQQPPPVQKPKFCAIVIPEYGDGMKAPWLQFEEPTTVGSSTASEGAHTPVMSGATISVDPSSPNSNAREDSAEVATIRAVSPIQERCELPTLKAPPSLIFTEGDDQRSPVLQPFDVEKLLAPSPEDSASDYSAASERLLDEEHQPQQPTKPDLLTDVIIPNLNELEGVRRNGSKNSDSSQDSVPGPATPKDIHDLVAFDFAVQNPYHDVDGSTESTGTAPTTDQSVSEQENPPLHGIRIKKTFSVESFFVDEASIPHSTVHHPLPPSYLGSMNPGVDNPQDYLQNDLNRSGSRSSIRYDGPPLVSSPGNTTTTTTVSKPHRHLAPTPLPLERSSSLGRVPSLKKETWLSNRPPSRKESNASTVIEETHAVDVYVPTRPGARSPESFLKEGLVRPGSAASGIRDQLRRFGIV